MRIHGGLLQPRWLGERYCLTRAPWLSEFCPIGRTGAALHPALLSAAATSELTAEARFDETRFRNSLARLPAPHATGAYA